MPHHFHAVVCIDHAEALVFEFAESGVTEHRIRPKDGNGNIHHKAGSMGSGHAHDSKAYLTAVADALQPSHEILIVGHCVLYTYPACQLTNAFFLKSPVKRWPGTKVLGSKPPGSIP